MWSFFPERVAEWLNCKITGEGKQEDREMMMESRYPRSPVVYMEDEADGC